MRVYHEISPEKLDSVLQDGIKQGSSGKKSSDEWIKKTDLFLDENRPESLIELGISRKNTIYAYLVRHSMIFSINDGQEVPISAFIKQSSEAIVEIAVEADKCYISDLDIYDTVKSALETGSDKRTLRHLASTYWKQLTPLTDYETVKIRRPEVMITYDIPRSAIRVSKSK